MTPSAAELIELVYRFHPRGVWPSDPRYDLTAEHRRQLEARDRARADYDRWRAMHVRLRARFPECTVRDQAAHLWGSGAGPSCSAQLVLPSRDDGEHALGFQVSILAPLYVVYGWQFSALVGNPGGDVATIPEIHLDLSAHELPYARAVAAEIEATYGHAPLPPEVGRVIVPDVATSLRAMGEATIYDCLLSDDWIR